MLCPKCQNKVIRDSVKNGVSFYMCINKKCTEYKKLKTKQEVK